MSSNYEIVGYYNGSEVLRQSGLTPSQASKLAASHYPNLGVYWAVQNGENLPAALPAKYDTTVSADGTELRVGTPSTARVHAAIYIRELAFEPKRVAHWSAEQANNYSDGQF